ncbi:unnamed protein product [Brassica oleracea]
MQLSTTAKIQANQIRYTSLHYPNTHPPSTTPLRTPLPFTNPLNTHPPVHNSPENTSLVHKSPEHTPPVHNSPENTSPIHRSPEHTHPVPNSPQHTSPVHNSPKQTTTVHNSPQHTPSVPPRSKLIAHVRTSPFPASPSGTPPWLYTPESFPVIYRSSSTILLIILTAPPPPLHHLLNQGLEIFEPFSQEPSSLNNPRYDTSSRKDPQQQLNPITPETSPTKSSGFPEHADSVNAFAATATSKRTSAPILNFDQRQDCVDVSDSSPARPTPWHQPSDEECHLAVELRKCPSISALALLVPLPHTQWELFKSTLKSNIQVFHITLSKFDFSNKFILEIAEPQNGRFILMQHMEIFMYMLAGRHKEMLHREALAFTTPLVSGIQELWKRFKPLRRKDLFPWGERLTELVLKAGEKWMEDVTTIYTPMIWADKHWVGLAINLDMGYVEIMDPQPSLNKDKKVSTFMEALLTALLYLVKKVAKPQQTQFRGLEPFYWKRMKDIYINERSGDCGPLIIKFMEFHAHGDPAPHMSGITYIAVDDLHKQYAMDVYKTIVLPAYHAPTFP